MKCFMKIFCMSLLAILILILMLIVFCFPIVLAVTISPWFLLLYFILFPVIEAVGAE